MIRIITRDQSLFSSEYWKDTVKKFLGRKRGPDAVKDSLVRGFKALQVPFTLNRKETQSTDIYHVISGIKALQRGIRLKESGKIKALIAGPNLVELPHDYNSIILNPAVDMVLHPSPWTKRMYTHFAPQLESRIHIWPAGVNDPYSHEYKRTKHDHIIIYQKNSPLPLFEQVKASAQNNFKKITIFNYGSFSHHEYLKTLGRADALIYLSSSESQGLALSESWIRDVPTLVWNRGYIEKGNFKFEGEDIAAPYLCEENGLFFSEKDDIEAIVMSFKNKLEQIHPRKWCQDHLSDLATTRIYLSLVNRFETKD